MRWNVILFLFSILALAILISDNVHAAVIYGGKIYSGQTFTTNVGGNFRVYGSDPYFYTDNKTEIKEKRYRKVVITSDVDEKVTIFNGTCESTYLYKYCYLSSYLDLDNSLTYRNGDIDTSMSITIETLPPPATLIKITRPTVIYAYCSQLIEIPILILNEGTVPTNITYTETLPENTFVAKSENGIVQGTSITFSDRLLINETANFTYTITNFDCLTKSWNAKYTFTTYNDSITKNLTNLTLSMLKFYNLSQNITPDRVNNLNDDMVYTINFTNTHPTQALYLDMMFYPEDLSVVGSSNGISYDNRFYRYTNLVASGKSINIFMTLNSIDFGKNYITNNLSIKLNDRLFNNDSIVFIETIAPTVKIFFNITSTEKIMKVHVYAYNTNLKDKYYYIYGVLKGVDSTEEPLYSNGIDPDKTILLGTKDYDISFMNKTVNLTFSGIYRDIDGIENDISYSRLVNITPSGVAIVLTKEEIASQNILNSTTKNSSSGNSKSNDDYSNIGTSSSANSNSKPKDDRDFITKVIEGLSNLLQNIFS
jgi:hypothetical protein